MITLEPPPSDLPPNAREYINRLVREIHAELMRAKRVPLLVKLPLEPQRGELVDFLVDIPPAIPAAGMYYYDGSTWIQLLSIT